MVSSQYVDISSRSRSRLIAVVLPSLAGCDGATKALRGSQCGTGDRQVGFAYARGASSVQGKSESFTGLYGRCVRPRSSIVDYSLLSSVYQIRAELQQHGIKLYPFDSEELDAEEIQLNERIRVRSSRLR